MAKQAKKDAEVTMKVATLKKQLRSATAALKSLAGGEQDGLVAGLFQSITAMKASLAFIERTEAMMGACFEAECSLDDGAERVLSAYQLEHTAFAQEVL